MKFKIPNDKYLLLLIVLAFAFAIYWIYFGNLVYSTYQYNFYDIGLETYDTYWHLHGSAGLSLFNVIQYLIFANHISPFRVLLLPIFAIYQQPITLIAIQALFVSIASLAIYKTSEKLLKSKSISFLFSIAFLLNPGVSGLLYYPIHSEAFIPLFYILAFYFYISGNKAKFLISYALLLSIMEEAPFIGASLLVGLLILNKKFSKTNKDNNTHIGMLKYASVMTFAAIVIYSAIGFYLHSQYPGIPYSEVSPLIRYGNFISTGISLLSNPGGIGYNGTLLYALGFEGLLIVFLGFGYGSLKNPVLSIVLCLPWLISVFILHNASIANYHMQYYSFVVGGSFVAALIGYASIIKSKDKFSRISTHGIVLLPLILTLTLPSALFASPFIIAGTTTQNYTAIDNALSSIPQNATVMAQNNVLPHIYNIRNIEFQPSVIISNSPFAANGIVLHWFSPQYIIIYYNTSEGKADTGVPPTTLLNYVNKSYTQYYNRSGLVIFKRSPNAS